MLQLPQYLPRSQTLHSKGLPECWPCTGANPDCIENFATQHARPWLRFNNAVAEEGEQELLARVLAFRGQSEAHLGCDKEVFERAGLCLHSC